MAKRKNYQSDFKVQVVLESLQRDSTIEKVRTRYQVSASVINKWRSVFKRNAYRAFEDGAISKKVRQEDSPKYLKGIIGELTVENTLLKKALSVWG